MPKKKDSLATYRAKRDFTKTPEPSGDEVVKKTKKRKNHSLLCKSTGHRACIMMCVYK